MGEPLFQSLLRHPLPTLDQWLDEHGTGARADGYDDFAALKDLLGRTLAADRSSYSDRELSFFRLWMGFGLATVELANIEHQNDQEPVDVVQMLPRAMGHQAMYAAASILADDAPWRSLSKIMIEEFRLGAKDAADTLERAVTDSSPTDTGEK